MPFLMTCNMIQVLFQVDSYIPSVSEKEAVD